MNLIIKIRSSLNRRDESTNVILAKQIAEKNDKDAVRELVNNLDNKNIQNDCIKVLYETGKLKPELISPYIEKFINLLNSKNNRLQWGAMTAIDAIVLKNSEAFFHQFIK